MLLIYHIAIRFYYLFIYLASFFNRKAKLWITGRKKVIVKPRKNSIWFHFASLGEFEQGRPVLEKMKALYPEKPVVVTFFSPSGYEVRKNTPLADAVYYLPLDTPQNARNFIGAVQPDIAIFTKYEYWYYFFNELNRRQIPLYIISGIFRPGQVFFKWYGGLHRKMLGMVSHFFVQDDDSQKLLQKLNVLNVTISGDTRFDRVWANAQKPRPLPEIEEFKAGKKIFVAGSTWTQDEELLANILKFYPDWKFIFAPHEIAEEKINKLTDLLPPDTFIRYSQLTTHNSPLTTQTLIIDNIGMLSSLYQYGEVAYIGGGFGAGIHNTLEAAAFGLPVIFGPNYQKFREACELVELKAGISISSMHELRNAAGLLMEDEAYRINTSKTAAQYVAGHTGATEAIVGYIAER